MKRIFLLSAAIIIAANNGFSQGTAINSSGVGADGSAMLDVSSNSKGMLIPRLTTGERNAIVSPAEGLQIFNTTSKCLEFYVGNLWQIIACGCSSVPASPVAGASTPSTGQIDWTWYSVSGATGYKWNSINDYNSATDLGNSSAFVQNGLDCNTAYTIYIWAYNACGTSSSTMMSDTTTSYASGGTITQAGGYITHTFTTSGIFNPTGAINVEVLVVGGGGGGGGNGGGGGGGGGVVYQSGYAVSGSTIVTVGTGGAGQVNLPPVNGTNSVFGTLTAIGGGGGGSRDTYQAGNSGGSGGGGGAQNGGTPGSGTAGQGNTGGAGSGELSCNSAGGGGGGAGSTGFAGSYQQGGNGGDGATYFGNIYGGGGGGGVTCTPGTPGTGGTGGGGNGNITGIGYAGADGLGGGGGGGGNTGPTNGYGGDGGDGVVIVRYPDCVCYNVSAPVATNASGALQNQFTANWNAVSGATGYYLDVSTSNNFSGFVSGYQNRDVNNVTTYNVTGLNCNMTYYYRLRAYNSCATSSNSNTITTATTACFSCGVSSITDIDGNSYTTVAIGTQCWMKENLKVTKNPGGSPITRYCYNNDNNNCTTFGGLYSWTTMMNGSGYSNSEPSGVQGICPDDWHIPSDAEWITLENYLSTDVGGKMKTTGTLIWSSPNTGATNSSDFSGLPGGRRLNSSGAYSMMFTNGYWRSTSSPERPRRLDYDNATLNPDCCGTYEFSIRCIKN